MNIRRQAFLAMLGAAALVAAGCANTGGSASNPVGPDRSEERRVGKECRL